MMNVRPFQVFVIAVYGGKSKSNDLQFLDETIQELNRLIVTGIRIGDVCLSYFGTAWSGYIPIGCSYDFKGCSVFILSRLT